jgi:hypothetical protein
VSVDDYVCFLESMGHRVVIGDSTYWFNVASGVYMNFPFHRPARPEYTEISEVLGLKGIALRHTCPLGEGRPSFKIVCSDKDYDLSNLPQKGRNRTRRGLENCVVKQLDFGELESLGALELSRNTFTRQGRRISSSHDRYWRKYYSAAAATRSMETWGAFVDGDLGAYLIGCQIEDCMNILIVRSSAERLKESPNNALLYIVVRDVISRPEISEISLGLEPVEPGLEDLDRFKMNMGFTKVPIGQKVHVNALLRPFLTAAILKGFQRLTAANFGGQSVRKLDGLLNWYCNQLVAKEVT